MLETCEALNEVRAHVRFRCGFTDVKAGGVSPFPWCPSRAPYKMPVDQSEKVAHGWYLLRRVWVTPQSSYR